MPSLRPICKLSTFRGATLRRQIYKELYRRLSLWLMLPPIEPDTRLISPCSLFWFYVVSLPLEFCSLHPRAAPSHKHHSLVLITHQCRLDLLFHGASVKVICITVRNKKKMA